MPWPPDVTASSGWRRDPLTRLDRRRHQADPRPQGSVANPVAAGRSPPVRPDPAGPPSRGRPWRRVVADVMRARRWHPRLFGQTGARHRRPTLLAGVSESAAARSANGSTVSAGRQATARAPHRRRAARRRRGLRPESTRGRESRSSGAHPPACAPRRRRRQALGGKVVSDTHQGWPEAAVDQRDLAAERSKLRIGRRGAPVCRRATDANARIAPSMTERALTSSASDRPLRRTGPREPRRSHFPAGLSMPCASCEDRSTRRRRLVAARGRSHTRRSETPGVAVCDLAGNSAVIPRAGHRANCHGGPMRSAVSLRR